MLPVSEFRNRLDGIIQFEQLGLDMMEKIVHKFLDKLKVMLKDASLN